MAWDYSHGSPPRWTGPMPMTVPTLAEQTVHGPIVQVSGGYVLTADGHIAAFGNMSRNNLPTAGGFVQVVAGSHHGLALTADGHIVGFGSRGRHPYTKDMPTTGGFVQVAAGQDSGFALTADGHIVAFGDDTQQNRKDLPSGGGFVQITTKSTVSFALTSDGHIAVFGNYSHTAERPPTQAGFVSVQSAWQGGYALTADGHIVAFGEVKDDIHKDVPLQGGFAQLCGGFNHGLALTADGHVVAFGMDVHGERKGVPTGGGFVQVDQGAAVTPDGHIITFGQYPAEQELPLYSVAFDAHPYKENAGVVTVHMAARPAPTVPNNAGSVFPTVLPYEIDWGDGTPNTPVPVGTATTDVFTHTYADPTVDHTLRIVYPKAVRDAAAGNPAATASIDTAGTKEKAQYLFVYDDADKLFHPADVQVYDTTDSAFHAAEVNVYDAANSKWVK